MPQSYSLQNPNPMCNFLGSEMQRSLNERFSKRGVHLTEIAQVLVCVRLQQTPRDHGGSEYDAFVNGLCPLYA